eukprot:TRINITY_DN11248_c0_g1_i2.p1 TRINITY_DN11248_c0_g1~~TRINITY_DN11248_c0_g1_i2.p1  ORF type:complete len:487 (+),score=51.65 TRINITY_DN11248_c0_g1_i2:55-1461(+)
MDKYFRRHSASVKLPSRQHHHGFDEQSHRLLQAQCFALSYLHYYLPIYPVCWLVRKVDPEFLVVYLQKRSRYGTLKCIVAAAFFALCLPFAYAHTLMAYPCTPKEMALTGGNITRVDFVRELDCAFQDWMMSPKSFLLGGASLVLSTLVMSTLYRLMGDDDNFNSVDRTLYQFLSQRIVTYLPNVFYNGMGRMGTRHSSKQVFHENGLDMHYSWMHDLFGTVDYAMICITLALSMSISFVTIGCYSDGYKGIAVGGLFGYVISLFEFVVMNYVLGASYELIEIVDCELRRFAPEGSALDFDVNPPVLKGTTRYTMRQQVEKSASLYDQFGNTLIAEEIRKHGMQVLNSLITRLIERVHTRYMSRECCFHLFQARFGTFATDHYSVDCLSLIDMNALLCAYFDPSLHTWKSHRYCINKVYIAVPHNVHCAYSDTLGWIVQDMKDMRESLDDEITQRFAVKRGHSALHQV